MVINFILWVVFGALIGWIASYLTGEDLEDTTTVDVVSGLVGAIVGGGVTAYLSAATITGFDLTSFVASIIAAVVLVGIVNAFRGNAGAEEHKFQH